MSMKLIAQNAKTLMESVYEYDRLINSKASKKELAKVAGYAVRIIESMRKTIEDERKHGQRKG